MLKRENRRIGVPIEEFKFIIRKGKAIVYITQKTPGPLNIPTHLVRPATPNSFASEVIHANFALPTISN